MDETVTVTVTVTGRFAHLTVSGSAQHHSVRLVFEAPFD